MLRRIHKLKYIRPFQTILILVLVIYFIFDFIFSENTSITHKEYCQLKVNENYAGVIDSSYFDIMQKGNLYVILKDSTKFSLYSKFSHYPHSLVEISIRKGDSIVKNRGESSYWVYKSAHPDSVSKFDFSCPVSQEKRDQTKNGLKSIKNQIFEDPSTLWPMLGEALLEEGSGNSVADWEDATNENVDFGKRKHLYSNY